MGCHYIKFTSSPSWIHYLWGRKRAREGETGIPIPKLWWWRRGKKVKKCNQKMRMFLVFFVFCVFEFLFSSFSSKRVNKKTVVKSREEIIGKFPRKQHSMIVRWHEHRLQIQNFFPSPSTTTPTSTKSANFETFSNRASARMFEPFRAFPLFLAVVFFSDN